MLFLGQEIKKPLNCSSRACKIFKKIVHRQTYYNAIRQNELKQNVLMQMQSKDKYLKRARAKYISRRFSLALLDYNPDSPLSKSYTNTLYCNQNLQKNSEGHIVGTYCKNRWCLVCGRIRTANLIEGYLPEFQKFVEPYFVTLTLPTVDGSMLADRIEEMEKEWRLIMKRAIVMRADFKGVRKMECTIRPDNHYHYHYHILLNGYDNAKWLVSQWLTRFPQASPSAQHLTTANENSYKELFKYFTKIITTTPNNIRLVTDFVRLDFLFRTLKSKHTFRPFGGVKKVSEEMDKELESMLSDDIFGSVWRWVVSDWYNEYGEALTNYEPSNSLKELLSECPEN